MKRGYIFLLISSVLLLLTNCRSKESILEEAPLIDIAGYENNTIDCSQFISDIDTLLLSVDSTCYVSQIQDFCLNDSCIYILDKDKSVFVFNSLTGELKNSINKIGRGRSEYLDPKSISEFEGCVYILDFGGRCVLEYDAELNFLDRIKIKFTAIDFMKVDDGFLFYNLTATDKLKRIVHTDNKGNVLNSFASSQLNINTILTERIFCSSGNDGFYISEPVSDIIQEWKDDTVDVAFKFDWENKNDITASKTSELITKNGINILYSLVSSKYVLTQFLGKDFILSNIYNRDDKTSVSGMVDTHLSYPFGPMKITGKSLIGIYESCDNKNLIMVKYNLLD